MNSILFIPPSLFKLKAGLIGTKSEFQNICLNPVRPLTSQQVASGTGTKVFLLIFDGFSCSRGLPLHFIHIRLLCSLVFGFGEAKKFDALPLNFFLRGVSCQIWRSRKHVTSAYLAPVESLTGLLCVVMFGKSEKWLFRGEVTLLGHF